MARRVAGIDVGGTFTDLLLLEEAGAKALPRVLLAKTPTTPDNQAAGVLAAIHQTGVAADSLDLVVHGTTTTTNAVLERKIAAWITRLKIVELGAALSGGLKGKDATKRGAEAGVVRIPKGGIFTMPGVAGPAGEGGAPPEAEEAPAK